MQGTFAIFVQVSHFYDGGAALPMQANIRHILRQSRQTLAKTKASVQGGGLKTYLCPTARRTCVCARADLYFVLFILPDSLSCHYLMRLLRAVPPHNLCHSSRCPMDKHELHALANWPFKRQTRGKLRSSVFACSLLGGLPSSLPQQEQVCCVSRNPVSNKSTSKGLASDKKSYSKFGRPWDLLVAPGMCRPCRGTFRQCHPVRRPVFPKTFLDASPPCLLVPAWRWVPHPWRFRRAKSSWVFEGCRTIAKLGKTSAGQFWTHPMRTPSHTHPIPSTYNDMTSGHVDDCEPMPTSF